MPRPSHCTWFLLLALLVPGHAAQGEDPPTRPAAAADALRDYHAANGLLQKGLFDLAEKEYRQFLADQADHEKAATARYGLAVCLFRTGRLPAAAAELQPLAEQADFPFAAEVLLMLGQCRMTDGKDAAAAALFDRLLRSHADHKLADEAAVLQIEALYRAGQQDAAAEAASAFLTSRTKSPIGDRALYFGGLADIARGRFDNAGDRFAAILKDHPKSPLLDRATLALAQCRQQAGQPKEAERYYRSLLDRKSDAPQEQVQYGLALLLLQQGKPREAGDLLDKLTPAKDSESGVAVRMARARCAFDSGDFARAQESFAALADGEGPTAEDAAYWAAKCEFRQSEFAEAARRLARLARRSPESKLRAEITYDRAVALLRAGQAEKAVEILRGFLADFTDHVLAADALQLLATTLHQSGKYDESAEQCRDFLRRFASHKAASAVAFVAAENAFLAGRYDSAITAYQDFLKQHAGDALAEQARFRLALSLYRRGKLDDAEPMLDGLAAKARTEEQFRAVLLCLGDIHFSRGKWEPAAKMLRDYLAAPKVPPLADDALLKLAVAEERLGRHEDALRDFERLIEAHPDSPHRPQAIFERGQVLVALNRHEEAARAFETVLKLDGDSRFAPYARNHLAILAQCRGEHAKAAELFAAAADSAAPESLRVDAGLQKACALMDARNFAAAEKAFDALLASGDLGERGPEARARRAICVARQDRVKDALAAMKDLDGDALPGELKTALEYERAWCLKETGQREEAAKVYRHLIDTAAREKPATHAMLELAAMEMDAKRFQSAVTLLRQIVAAAPGTGASEDSLPLVAYRLGVCQYELGDFPAAAATLEGFLLQPPKGSLADAAALYCGEAFFRAGQFEKAARYLARAAEAVGSDASAGPALLRLGEAQAQLQQWARSEQTFEKFLRLAPDGEGWYQARFGVGWARENQGRYDEAIQSYRQVVEKHDGPTAARAQFQIGQCLFARKKYDEAVRELLKVDILYAYPEWSAAALYEAGRCFESLARPVDARRQFQSVAEKHADTNWAKLARQRLSELKTAAMPGHDAG